MRAVHVDHGLQSAAAALSRSLRGLVRGVGHSPDRHFRRRSNRRPAASLEAAAREARYAALAAELRPGECLLTAHHAEDQAETLLLQALARGRV